MGDNSYGELVTAQPCSDSRQLLQNAEKISASKEYICAITKQHTIYCWGSNEYGELGTGDRNNRNYATKITIKPVKLVVVGGGGRSPWEFFIPHEGEHTCTVTLDDKVYCWRANGYGQLGTGNKTDRLTPTTISLP